MKNKIILTSLKTYMPFFHNFNLTQFLSLQVYNTVVMFILDLILLMHHPDIGEPVD